MNVERSWLTCREAGKILNYTQRHILNLIKNGKISADKDDDGRYYIQKAELYRVYPHILEVEKDRSAKKPDGKNTLKFLEEKIRHLEEMVGEKSKQNEFLVEQLNNFTQEKSKMLEAINSNARLLEFKETSGKYTHVSDEKQDKKPFKWWPFKKH